MIGGYPFQLLLSNCKKLFPLHDPNLLLTQPIQLINHLIYLFFIVIYGALDLLALGFEFGGNLLLYDPVKLINVPNTILASVR